MGYYVYTGVITNSTGETVKYPIAYVGSVEGGSNIFLVAGPASTLWVYNSGSDSIENTAYTPPTGGYSGQVRNIISSAGLDGFINNVVAVRNNITKDMVVGRIDPLYTTRNIA